MEVVNVYDICALLLSATERKIKYWRIAMNVCCFQYRGRQLAISDGNGQQTVEWSYDVISNAMLLCLSHSVTSYRCVFRESSLHSDWVAGYVIASRNGTSIVGCVRRTGNRMSNRTACKWCVHNRFKINCFLLLLRETHCIAVKYGCSSVRLSGTLFHNR